MSEIHFTQKINGWSGSIQFKVLMIKYRIQEQCCIVYLFFIVSRRINGNKINGNKIKYYSWFIDTYRLHQLKKKECLDLYNGFIIFNICIYYAVLLFNLYII